MMSFEGKTSPTFQSCFTQIYVNENIKGFYKGLQDNILQACILNGTKIACYDQIKDKIIETNIIPQGIPTQFCAAFGDGFFMASTVAPFDMVRTKLMNQTNTNRIYSGFIDCFVKIVRQNGILGLYAGFVPI